MHKAAISKPRDVLNKAAGRTAANKIVQQRRDKGNAAINRAVGARANAVARCKAMSQQAASNTQHMRISERARQDG